MFKIFPNIFIELYVQSILFKDNTMVIDTMLDVIRL
jgi:hypothetical protein